MVLSNIYIIPFSIFQLVVWILAKQSNKVKYSSISCEHMYLVSNIPSVQVATSHPPKPYNQKAKKKKN